jgi:hypothetical protein
MARVAALGLGAQAAHPIWAHPQRSGGVGRGQPPGGGQPVLPGAWEPLLRAQVQEGTTLLDWIASTCQTCCLLSGRVRPQASARRQVPRTRSKSRNGGRSWNIFRRSQSQSQSQSQSKATLRSLVRINAQSKSVSFGWIEGYHMVPPFRVLPTLSATSIPCGDRQSNQSTSDGQSERP